MIEELTHDVREPLPLRDDSVNAIFAHALLCMVRSTKEIHGVSDEVRRVNTAAAPRTRAGRATSAADLRSRHAPFTVTLPTLR